MGSDERLVASCAQISGLKPPGKGSHQSIMCPRELILVLRQVLTVPEKGPVVVQERQRKRHCFRNTL